MVIERSVSYDNGTYTCWVRRGGGIGQKGNSCFVLKVLQLVLYSSHIPISKIIYAKTMLTRHTFLNKGEHTNSINRRSRQIYSLPNHYQIL